ncbi:hypothetical protein PF005_g17199 [Phytophthora fragariae]|uniref:Uncharacterized protein n=1 Tax=Phytophthora fragariae TaxID=53985 RepID=A0A6A3Y0P2_9STRA|nr:hypothetical protein PF003_g10459 [Phytophthora fragariae]KAE8931540.1 hypothetical protein PF009_g18397 [Phytophthora fragariae]KAE8994762.1 hypothetical protein PF011_g16613 [Phytophthora fragariae]KAE9095552.1 hypothetical protein PF007_g17333 [Phytophthora fragariae]KAE9126021.1 hypothetical protein PF006_g16828 [Phytophthora fragariae]
MNHTRPIPIGGSGSQRGSPVTRSHNGAALVAHSLPADMHHVHLSRFMTSSNGVRASGLQPPRAPLVGSMPEPSFLELDSMPDLALGPPAETIREDSPPRAPAVIQFASSCPGDIGFLRSNPTRGSWTPSLQPYPAEHDDFDLSKSPALAAMSALRERMGDLETTQQASNGSSYSRSFSARAAGTQPSRDYYASDESSSYPVSAELLERLSITSEEEGEGAEDRDERYRVPGYNSQMPSDQRRRAERRGSYGNVSDTGDTGIFEFDDQ